MPIFRLPDPSKTHDHFLGARTQLSLLNSLSKLRFPVSRVCMPKFMPAADAAPSEADCYLRERIRAIAERGITPLFVCLWRGGARGSMRVKRGQGAKGPGST